MNTEVLYREINPLLQQENSVKDAAEIHGILCGLFCGNNSIAYSQWEYEIFSESPSALVQVKLQQLFTSTLLQLNDSNFSLQLFLPEDSVALVERTAALGNWCQGLLLGLTISGGTGLKGITPETEEFTTDLLKISQVGEFILSNNEEDEEAYMELTEYVRAGVMLIKEENAALRNPGVPTSLH